MLLLLLPPVDDDDDDGGGDDDDDDDAPPLPPAAAEDPACWSGGGVQRSGACGRHTREGEGEDWRRSASSGVSERFPDCLLGIHTSVW